MRWITSNLINPAKKCKFYPESCWESWRCLKTGKIFMGMDERGRGWDSVLQSNAGLASTCAQVESAWPDTLGQVCMPNSTDTGAHTRPSTPSLDPSMILMYPEAQLDTDLVRSAGGTPAHLWLSIPPSS